MKKVLSTVLAFVMVFPLMIPITATANDGAYEKLPMIYIRGNGWHLFDENGKEVKTGFDVFGADDEESTLTKETIIETAINILLPFLAGGMLADEWEAYGDALYEELAPLWEDVILDGDGNTKNGIVADPGAYNFQENVRAYQDTGTDGYYDIEDYSFVYDWRLSPYDSVERLHAYVQKVMKTTKSSQVCLSSRCMGGGLLNAYLERYGHLGHVKKAFYSDVLSNGCAYLSDTFSGKIKLDAKVMQTYLKQLEYCGETGFGAGYTLSELASEFVGRTMDLMTQLGVVDTVLGGFENLYTHLYQEFIPAIVLATGYATYPNSWVSVYEEDMDTALNLVFGSEGSEERQENAGLIEKILYYREHVQKDLPGFYKKISQDYGIKVGVLARYGYVGVPYMESSDDLSDALVSLQDASFGATTVNAFTPLSDEYVQEKVDAGLGDYISPDKMVDTSTCAFPETTWIVKNCHHDPGMPFEKIATYFFRYENVTASANDRNLARFSVYCDGSTTSTGYLANMTEENMADFDWLHTAEQKPTNGSKLKAFIKWLTTLFEFFAKLLKGEISLGK